MIEEIKKGFKEQGITYYIFFIVALIICYGFTVSNYSISIDDEKIYEYIYGNEWLQQGRWFSVVGRHIFPVYDFLPFFRSSIALIFILLGITLYNNLFKVISKGDWTQVKAIIFSCLSISCPIIPFVFIFETMTIELGMIIIFSGISIYNIFYFYNYKNRIYYIGSVMFLVLGIGIYESCIMFYVIGIANSFFLVLMSDDKNWNLSKLVKGLCTAISSLFISILLNEIIKKILWKLLGITPSDYVNQFYKGFLNNIFHFNLLRTNRGIIFFVVIFLVLFLLYSIKRKNNIFLLYSLLYFSSIFFISTITLSFFPLRSSAYLMVLISFVITNVLYVVVKLIPQKRAVQFLSYLIIIVIFIYQASMLNQLFYRDYVRYQQDKQYAEMVYKDIKKIVGNKKNDIKVVFKGFPDYYKRQQIEMIGDSYFFHDREYSEYFEKTSPRIVDFMKMLGMKVKAPSFEEVEKIWGDSLNMEPWPMESSIKKIDDIVLVKLGESPYSSYKMSRDDFIKKFKYKIKKEGIIKEEKKKIYNQASVYYCADLKIKMNEDIQVFLVRSYKNTQHVYDVSDLIYPAEKFPNLNIQLNFAEDINERNNSYELYLVYYINGTGYIEKI